MAVERPHVLIPGIALMGENSNVAGKLGGIRFTEGSSLRDDGHMAESQLSELRNMRVLLEEARVLTRGLAYHRRARLEAVLGQALDEIDRQIEELRSEGRG
jgi:hypothetical protein